MRLSLCCRNHLDLDGEDFTSKARDYYQCRRWRGLIKEFIADLHVIRQVFSPCNVGVDPHDILHPRNRLFQPKLRNRTLEIWICMLQVPLVQPHF